MLSYCLRTKVKGGVGGSRRLPPFGKFGKGGRGDFVPHNSVASPFRAFRVFRSALVPKSLQSSAFSLSYLPEQFQAGVTVPSVAGEVTVDLPMKLCVDNSGAGSRPWEGLRRQGPGRRDAVPARLTAACGQRVPSAASVWHFLCYTVLPWHGSKGLGARRSQIGRNGHRERVGRLPTRAGPQAYRPMKCRKIDAIILPYMEELPLTPSVAIGDKITHAVELMLSHNVSRIAVVRNLRAIGLIRLEDALQELGLEMPVKS